MIVIYEQCEAQVPEVVKFKLARAYFEQEAKAAQVQDDSRRKGTALRAAEKLCFVSGHDFSRAAHD
jgi:hypothetical protein